MRELKMRTAIRRDSLMICLCLVSVESSSFAQISETAKLFPFGPDVNNYFGGAVAISDKFLVVGDHLGDDFEEDGGSVSVFSGPVAYTGQQPDELFPIDTVPIFGFGNSVSASGGRIAVSSDTRTYLFRYENGVWVQELVVPYGSLSVSLTESYLAIGVALSPVGFVAVYRLDTGFDETDMSDDQWLEDSPILGPASLDSFGYAIAADHDCIVIGAPSGLLKGLKTGLAYVFERTMDGMAWVATAKLEPIGATEKAGFGRALSVRGDLIVVGAPLDHPTSGGAGKGAAFVYRRNPVSETWKSQGRLLARDGAADDLFGVSVAIGNDVVFVGAYFAEVGQKTFAGAAYQFAPGPNHDATARWHLVGKIAATDAQVGDQFGFSIAYGAGTLLIGAPGAGFGGAAYVLTAN